MRSSSGKHYPGLDHIRALAAFLVVFWHFSHGPSGEPVPFNEAPEIGLLDEGHVGVSLFMVLSGYLFAKLIGGRSISYSAFLWNRAVRLLPLLLVVLLFVGILEYRDNPLAFAKMVAGGVILPQLPNGGWSITAEFHFYLILPLLLWASARWRWAPLVLVATSMFLRAMIYASQGDVQYWAYWTIVGRIDQFALGILFSQQIVTGRLAGIALATIAVAYAAFDAFGGFYAGPEWPWIALPALEGVALGAIISWYDANPIRSSRMWLVEKAGDYSYSIYLLHFFYVFQAAAFVDEHIFRMNNVYAALPPALLFFVIMIGLGHATFKAIEEPALRRLRKRYIKTANAVEEDPPLPVRVAEDACQIPRLGEFDAGNRAEA